MVRIIPENNKSTAVDVTKGDSGVIHVRALNVHGDGGLRRRTTRSVTTTLSPQEGGRLVAALIESGATYPAELQVTSSEDLTQLKLLGGELRIWEPGVHGDDNERDLGRMFVLEALGVSLLVRERQDGTYVHVEDEGVIRKPLLVEVDNGGEHPYGKEE